MIYLINGVVYKDLRILRPQTRFDNLLQGQKLDGAWDQIKYPDSRYSPVLEEYLKQDSSILVVDDTQPRNVQFLGYAQALFNDLNWDEINIDMEPEGWENRWILRMAQRAYDFAEHVLLNMPVGSIDVERAPDLSELPEENKG